MNRVLQWVIWFAAMTVVMRWLAKSREVPASEQSLVLQYPRAILATGIVVGAMFLVMAVASFVAPSGGPGVAAIFLIFVALGAYLVAEYYVVRFHVLDDGLAYRTLFQRGMLGGPTSRGFPGRRRRSGSSSLAPDSEFMSRRCFGTCPCWPR